MFDAYHPDTPQSRQQGCENPWLFFEAERRPQAKKKGKTYFG
jgi:hypothetical protein